MFDISVITNNWPYFARGIWVTVLVTTSAAILGFCIAFVVALLRTSAFLPLRITAGAYLEVLRNIPFIILLFIFFYGLPFAGIRIPERLAVRTARPMFGACSPS